MTEILLSAEKRGIIGMENELMNFMKKNMIDCTKELKYSANYIFEIYDIFDEDFDRQNENFSELLDIKKLEIMKLNFQKIISQFHEYFDENIKIDIEYNTSCDTELEIKNRNCHLYDIYIKIFCDNKCYDIGIDYITNENMIEKQTFNKNINSTINIDFHKKYYEEYDDFVKFIKETIYDMFVILCTISDDKYTLAKVNYFKNYDKNNLELDTELFNKIIQYVKDGTFNVKEFYEQLNISSSYYSNEEDTFENFIEYLHDNYAVEIIHENNVCNYKFFTEILNVLDSDYSEIIVPYRRIYTNTMEILIESQEQIINFVKKNNNAKQNISKYMLLFLENDFMNYIDQSIIDKIRNS